MQQKVYSSELDLQGRNERIRNRSESFLSSGMSFSICGSFYGTKSPGPLKIYWKCVKPKNATWNMTEQRGPEEHAVKISRNPKKDIL